MLALDNIRVQFGGVTALQGVSFEMATREVVGLVGPNGAGKTTLFDVISGVVIPNAGRVMLNGAPLSGTSIRRRVQAGIGRTFQIPQPLHELTVRENLRVAQYFGSGRVDNARLDEILAAVNLLPKAEEDAATRLSLSERKALEVAKALATEPRLLLLDEVLAGLETAGKRAFMQTIKTVQARFGLTLLVIEHDIEVVSQLCPRVIVLDFGKIIADGSPQAVFNNPEVIRSYTGGSAATN